MARVLLIGALAEYARVKVTLRVPMHADCWNSFSAVTATLIYCFVSELATATVYLSVPTSLLGRPWPSWLILIVILLSLSKTTYSQRVCGAYHTFHASHNVSSSRLEGARVRSRPRSKRQLHYRSEANSCQHLSFGIVITLVVVVVVGDDGARRS